MKYRLYPAAETIFPEKFFVGQAVDEATKTALPLGQCRFILSPAGCCWGTPVGGLVTPLGWKCSQPMLGITLYDECAPTEFFRWKLPCFDFSVVVAVLRSMPAHWQNLLIETPLSGC